jgi:hypothetical protein
VVCKNWLSRNGHKHVTNRVLTLMATIANVLIQFTGIAKMRIWNLTPHMMHYDDGQTARAYDSDGVVRLEQVTHAAEPIEGLTTVTTTYGKLQGLPDEIAEGDVLLVSTLVGDYWNTIDRPPGVIVLVPDTGASCKRDAEGRIVSVSRFIRK